MKVVLVCGPTGTGKTTYSIELAKALGAVRFSIDPWMQNLFSKDMTSLDYSWIWVSRPGLNDLYLLILRKRLVSVLRYTT